MASQTTSNHFKRGYAGVQPVIDQAALHGLHKIVRNLGMPLISVNRLNQKLADEPDINSLR